MENLTPKQLEKLQDEIGKLSFRLYKVCQRIKLSEKIGQLTDDNFDDYDFSETQDGYMYYKDAKWLDSEKDYFSFDYLDNPKNGFEYKEDLKTYVRISN